MRSCFPFNLKPDFVLICRAACQHLLQPDQQSFSIPTGIFSQTYRIFPQNTKTFRKPNKRSLEIPKSSPIRRCVRRTENYPILKTFLIFFYYGDLAALELWKASKTGLTFIPYFPAKLVFLPFYYGTTIPKLSAKYQNFPQNIPNRGC